MKSPMKNLTDAGKNVNTPPKMPLVKIDIQRNDIAVNGDPTDLIPQRNGDLGGFPDEGLPGGQTKKPFSGLKG